MMHLEAIIARDGGWEYDGVRVYTPGNKIGGKMSPLARLEDRMRVREIIRESVGPMDHDVTLQDALDMETGPGLERVVL